MRPVSFPQKNIVFAEDQPEYIPLPAFIDRTRNETPVTSCWQLTWSEIWQLIWTRRLYVSIYTFKSPLQPHYLTVDPDEVLPIQGEFDIHVE